MQRYKFGALNINVNTCGYFYFGNISTHISVSENYFRFFNYGKTSFCSLQIFTEENEVNYEFLFRRILPVKFYKTFSIGKFYVTFLSE